MNEIHDMIENAYGKIDLPAGVIHVDRTIDLGKQSCLRISGCGLGYSQREFRDDGRVKIAFPMYATIINWVGPPDEPVFRTSGYGNIFEGITIWGQDRASAGWHIVRGNGVGTGKHRWTDCVVSNCHQGITHGENTSDGNCDLFYMDNVGFFDCESAVRVNNNQCVGGTINAMQANRCGNALDLDAGGSMTVTSLSVADTFRVLRMKHQGMNNCDIDIRGLNVDGKMKDGWRLFDNNSTARNRPKFRVQMSGKISNKQRKPWPELTNDEASLNCSHLNGYDQLPFIRDQSEIDQE